MKQKCMISELGSTVALYEAYIDRGVIYVPRGELLHEYVAENHLVWGDANGHIEPIAYCALSEGRLRWGLVDATTSKVITPPRWDDFVGFSEGIAHVCVDDEWRYVNEQGDYVVPEREWEE